MGQRPRDAAGERNMWTREPIMESRERVKRALEFSGPDRAPRDLWYLPGVGFERMDELDELLTAYPMDIVRAPAPYQPSKRAQGSPNRPGTYKDEWGCAWRITEPGVIGEVTHPPLLNWEALERWTPPYDLFERARWDEVDEFCRASKEFTVMPTEIRPFERVQFLRGAQNAFIDLLELSPEFLELRKRVHEWNLASVEKWMETRVDALYFCDDWGGHSGLVVDPDLWRELYKPLYKEYCDLAAAKGKYVFMHSDGAAGAIMEDLVEIGVHAFNTEIFAMDISALAEQFKGRITLWGEIDRQYLLPFGSPDEIRKAVLRVREAFDDGRGGLIAQCEWGNRDPKENIEAVYQAWLEPSKAAGAA